MKEEKREQRLGGITSGFPDPASWHFGLCSHYGLTCSSPTATPTSTPVTLRSLSVSSPAPRKLQWSETEHTNYSLVVPKIANNSVCVCVCEERVRVVLFLRQPCHGNQALLVSVSPSSSNVSFH